MFIVKIQRRNGAGNLWAANLPVCPGFQHVIGQPKVSAAHSISSGTKVEKYIGGHDKCIIFTTNPGDRESMKYHLLASQLPLC